MDAERISDAILVAGAMRARLAARLAFLATRPEEDTPEAEAAWAATYRPEPPPEPAPGGPRDALIRGLGLSVAEAALLDLAVAVAVDPALEPMVALAQGLPRRPVPTEALARRLLGLPAGAIWRPTAALARWLLLEPIADPLGAAPSFRADPRIADWYFGRAALDEGLVGLCTLPASSAGTADAETAADAELIAQLLEAGEALRVTLTGAPGSGRAGRACALLEALGRPALMVDGAQIPEARLDELGARLRRFAQLTGRTPVWTGPPPRWPAGSADLPLQLVLAEADARPAPLRGLADHVLPMAPLAPADRRALWTRLGGAAAPIPLALRTASRAEIGRVAPLARARPDLVARMLDQRARSELAGIGRIRHPTLGWDDMVLSPETLDALRDYAAEARMQDELMARPELARLYRREAAPTALFSGPPGVGKTMAAECVATELGLPLLVVDLSRVTSKYIGETAKNLSRAFAEARRFGCILFFDEADACFARRTEMKDSHDRHANADTSHLLQLTEEHDGPVILSTNKRGNIDDAFFRRIRHAIDFHRPSEAERARLWRHFAALFVPPAALVSLAPAFESCAKRCDLSPAQIKSAMLSAHCAARRAGADLSAAHLLAGIARELRKEGRGLPPELAAQRAGPARTEADHVA